MFNRRRFLKAGAAVPLVSVPPLVPVSRFAAVARLQVLPVPAVLHGVVRSIAAIPIGGGIAYMVEIEPANAAGPALWALIALATAWWGGTRLSRFLEADRGIRFAARDSDS